MKGQINALSLFTQRSQLGSFSLYFILGFEGGEAKQAKYMLCQSNVCSALSFTYYMHVVVLTVCKSKCGICEIMTNELMLAKQLRASCYPVIVSILLLKIKSNFMCVMFV